MHVAVLLVGLVDVLNVALFVLGYKKFWVLENQYLLVTCLRFVEVVLEECRFWDGVVGRFSFEGPCRPYILCNSLDDFRHRGHIKHHSIFLYVGTGF
jgi:hypothetical protein